MMKKSLKRTLAAAIGVCLIFASTCAAAEPDNDNGGNLLKAIVNSMGDDTTVTSDQYSAYFKESTAEEGVKAVITAGAFTINGFAIPATEEEYAQTCPDGYTVNGTVWLSKTDDSWYVDRKTYDSYDTAAVATASRVPAGLEVRLYDMDGDGYTDRIETRYLEALIVGQITKNTDGTYSVIREEFDSSTVFSENEGKAFDGNHFTAGSGEVIPADNFDTDIQAGDMALCWYGPDGWAMERAIQVNGIFVDGADHKYYQIGDIQYQDAMRFSRDNIVISNRCGEFANAHKYFGLTNNTEGLTVSLWFAPTTNYPDAMGAPAGFTTGKNASAFLTRAIAAAKEKLASVAVSTDGSDVAVGTKWTTQAAYDELNAAIARAERVLASDAGSSLLDYQVYLLYLTLHGGSDDIGAKFAGYDYAGFDNQVVEKSAEGSPAGSTYTVVAGDCLWNLASRFYGSGTQFGKIAQANGIAAPYTIYVGQTLTIPAL